MCVKSIMSSSKFHRASTTTTTMKMKMKNSLGQMIEFCSFSSSSSSMMFRLLIIIIISLFVSRSNSLENPDSNYNNDNNNNDNSSAKEILLVSQSIPSQQTYKPIIFIDKPQPYDWTATSARRRRVKLNKKKQQQPKKPQPPAQQKQQQQPQQQQAQQQKPKQNDNTNNTNSNVVTPTYRKLKYKRPQHHPVLAAAIYHNGHAGGPTLDFGPQRAIVAPSFGNDGNVGNSSAVTANTAISAGNSRISGGVPLKKFIPKKLTPSMTPSLYFYGPSMLRMKRIETSLLLSSTWPEMGSLSRPPLMQKSSPTTTVSNFKKRKTKLKRKRVKLVNIQTATTGDGTNNVDDDPTTTNAKMIVATTRNNHHHHDNNNEIEIRDPRPKLSMVFEGNGEAASSNEDFDILRNDIPRSSSIKHLRRSLPNLPVFPNSSSSSSSLVFQSPPTFRVESSSFGRPAPRPSNHWSYNNSTLDLRSRFTINPIRPLSSFRRPEPQPLPVVPVLPALQPPPPPPPPPRLPPVISSSTRQNRPAPPPHPPLPISSSSIIPQSGLHGLNGPIGGFPPVPRPRPTTPTTSTTTTTTTTTTTPTPPTRTFAPYFDYDYLPIVSQPTVATTPPKRKSSNKQRNKPSATGGGAGRRGGGSYSSSSSSSSRCTEDKCRLPYCHCGSAMTPGGLKYKETPQLVMITFDDSINDLNWDLYQEIFTDRYNPNGCPILGTFYVSHEWTDYSQVQNLYSMGHEMASHTITHSFGDKFSKEKWLNEVNGQREILNLYGGVHYDDVRGMRAPFLQPGGNNQFEMLYEANFTYDSSLPVFDNKPPYWPYTFDYPMSHECMIAPCPTKSFPGLWEVGMVMLIDHRGGRCSMVDACSHPATEQEVYEDLLKNFNRHYQTNKAPFGLYFHSAWFNTQHHKRGFLNFIDDIGKNKDVYFVTKWQLIQWMQHPTPVQRLKQFAPFHCDYSDRPPCNRPSVCSTSFRDGPRYLKTCQKCPKTYPWVGKTGFPRQH